MEDLQFLLADLIRQLECMRPAPDSSDAQTLWHLRHIQMLVEDGEHPAKLGAAFAALREFWIENISWCSKLSRDVEKLIIIYTDLSANACQGRWPEC